MSWRAALSSCLETGNKTRAVTWVSPQTAGTTVIVRISSFRLCISKLCIYFVCACDLNTYRLIVKENSVLDPVRDIVHWELLLFCWLLLFACLYFRQLIRTIGLTVRTPWGLVKHTPQEDLRTFSIGKWCYCQEFVAE